MTTYYDPPEGWRFGFPKPYKPRADDDFVDTLLRDGYPKHMLDLALRATRFWESENE